MGTKLKLIKLAMKGLYAFTKKLTARFSLKKKQTAIVYYVYINPNKDWRRLVLEQIDDVKNTHVLDVADLYIVVSNPDNVKDVDGFFEKLKGIYKEIKFYAENKFEYWGLLCVWHLAQENANYKYLAYFHTKGMTHPDQQRVKIEEVLTNTTFQPWQSLVRIFQTNQQVNKIGLFPARKLNAQGNIIRGGWIWYNFWWARAEYIRSLEPPKINPKHRYYYEEWLSYPVVDSSAKYYDNWSIYSMSMTAYTNQETLDHTERLLTESACN